MDAADDESSDSTTVGMDTREDVLQSSQHKGMQPHPSSPLFTQGGWQLGGNAPLRPPYWQAGSGTHFRGSWRHY